MISTALDQAKQPRCLAPRRVRCPGSAVLANRYLAQWRAAAGPDAVMQNVAWRTTALYARPEASNLGIPDDGFAAIRGRLQSIDSPLRDLVAHAHPSR